MFPILGRKEKAIYTEKEGNVGICNLKKISCVVSFPSPSFSSIRESFAIICCARNMARISASLDLINSLVAANNPASFRDRDLDAAKSSALTNFNNNRGRKIWNSPILIIDQSFFLDNSRSVNRLSKTRRSVKFRSIGSQYSVSSRFKFDCLTRSLFRLENFVALLFERKEEKVDYPKPMKRKVKNIFGIFLSYKTRWKECFVEIIVYSRDEKGINKCIVAPRN